jgi:hypothetical protein
MVPTFHWIQDELAIEPGFLSQAQSNPATGPEAGTSPGNLCRPIRGLVCLPSFAVAYTTGKDVAASGLKTCREGM